MFESPWIELIFIGFPILLFVFSIILRKWLEKRIKRRFQTRKIAKERKKNPCYNCPSVRKHHCNGCYRKVLKDFEAERGENNG